MIVSTTEFNTYSGNCETGNDVVALKESILKATQEIVTNYLGFNPESEQRDDFISGIGTNRLYLFAHPVTLVASVKIDGAALLSDEYTIDDNYLRMKQGVWPLGIENVEVVYTAGWSAQTLPQTVKMVILQIATLMLQEAGENIGITGKSFGENSRTFINYTNFEKWLKKLDPYRIMRLD